MRSTCTGSTRTRVAKDKSVEWDEEIETTVSTPAVGSKVAIQGEYVSGVQFVGQLNQTRIGKIRSEIAILAEGASNGRRGLSNPEGNLEHTPFHVLKDGLRRPLKPAQKIATLCNDCLR